MNRYNWAELNGLVEKVVKVDHNVNWEFQTFLVQMR